MSIIEQLRNSKHALTVPELAALLNMSRRTIYEHAAAGRIPTIRIGSAVRFDPSAVVEWLLKEQQ